MSGSSFNNRSILVEGDRDCLRKVKIAVIQDFDHQPLCEG